jgi:aminopeptidase-like protein
LDRSLTFPAFIPDLAGVGEEMHALMARLYPICRSITGNGVRETLRILREHIPLDVREVPSGTPVFDWTVPKEWNIKAAYLSDSRGRKVVDFKDANLHVLSYSVPVRVKLSLEKLKDHLYSAPEHPDTIPYRTSYYNENWGFCLSHNQLAALRDDEYEAFIDSSLENGHLTYGEYFLRGETESEVLISTHICHPSLANDNLSGIVLATFLAKHLTGLSLRYSYRFLFTPGTIGSITWLSVNQCHVSRIKHGLILACVGDAGAITYKKSRRGDAEIDRAVAQVLKDSGDAYAMIEFSPYGYDERQFCSPGFNLPVGCFMRTPHGEFPQYHTSADNLEFVLPEHLADSFRKCSSVFAVLESNKAYVNQNPMCEPQLGKRGLYRPIGGASNDQSLDIARLWLLNLSDGRHSLLDIAEKTNLGFAVIRDAAEELQRHALLKEVSGRRD